MAVKRRLARVAAHAVLIIVSLGVLAPVYWMVVSAISPMSAIFSPTLHLFPAVFHWNNFVRAWTSQPFGLYFFNSLFTNFAIVFVQLITSCL
ncbi:MAG: carbohydrate ABC transporter permease, partial [Bacilli bacterium]